MRPWVQRLLPLADVLLMPLVYPAAALLKGIRRIGVQRLPRCKAALLDVGVFPLRDHYYEPQFDYRAHAAQLTRERELPGIDWNVPGQLALLERMRFAAELTGIPRSPSATRTFHFDNGTFESGDAEYWYQLIRVLKPRRLIEIGSGNSTLMAIAALARNAGDDPAYRCEHVCIEPYEAPWLEQTGVTVVRSKVEDLAPAFFADLTANDILFIDSSHVIRPHGDVLFEFLEILPTLARGVYVHVHDIFSPRHYLAHWLTEDVRFWNEQYLLEAFLSHNASWRVVGALNYLHHHHYERLAAVAPYLTPERAPGSFYLQKVV